MLLKCSRLGSAERPWRVLPCSYTCRIRSGRPSRLFPYLHDFSRSRDFGLGERRDRKPAIQPTAAAPASPVPVSQHCRHAYSCSSTAARPPPSLRVSAPPQSLRLAPHIAPHTTSTSAASPKPQALQPQASSLTHAPRLATAHPDPHAWRPLSLHVTCKRHALSSLLPLPHRLTHTAPRKPLQ